MVQILDTILGYASEPFFSEALHRLEHAERVEVLTIAPDDVARRRFRLKTDRGTDCAVSLPRQQGLSDGAILELSDQRAIVIRLSEREWLTLAAPDQAAALELGYFLGNLHWKVRFADGRIHVALEGPRQTYLERLEGMRVEGKVLIEGKADA